MPISTFKSPGIFPPGTGSARTKNVPVPMSGWVQRETVQPAILWFSMIGKGGPLCAFAGNASSNTSAAAASSPAIEMERFGIEEYSELRPVILTAHQRGAHFHRLKNQPQCRTEQHGTHQRPRNERAQRSFRRIFFRYSVSHRQRSGKAQHEEPDLEDLHGIRGQAGQPPTGLSQ